MKQACAVLAAAAVLTFGAAVQAAGDDVAVIVNKANPVLGMTVVQLRAILLGAGVMWTGGDKITVVMTSPGQPERSGMLRIVCGMSETDFNMHFIRGWRKADGSVSTGLGERPMVVGSGQRVRQSVAANPSAMGFINASEVDDSVRVVKIDGNIPGQSAYRLKTK